MPHITAIIEGHGPVITAYIGLSFHRATAMRSAGKTVPNFLPCNLLIDTGASATCVDISLIRALSLSPTGSSPIHTPSTGSTPHFVNTYDISLIIPGNGNTSGQPKVIEALPIMECNFETQSIDGLLGRDVLSQSRMIYSGHDDMVMLSII